MSSKEQDLCFTNGGCCFVEVETKRGGESQIGSDVSSPEEQVAPIGQHPRRQYFGKFEQVSSVTEFDN